LIFQLLDIALLLLYLLLLCLDLALSLLLLNFLILHLVANYRAAHCADAASYCRANSW
jgi:hypothetical protein